MGFFLLLLRKPAIPCAVTLTHKVPQVDASTMLSLCLLLLLSLGMAVVMAVDPAIVPLSAYVSSGAVCLDGSTPAYYYRPGVGAGANNWIIHMEGGGWCGTESDCYARSLTTLGSSTQWPPTLSPSNQLCCSLGGFLSDDPAQNPNFYTWNLAWIGYCDGSSFSGNLDSPILYNNSTLYFRGARILESAITDLLTNKNLSKASTVVVSGCSAGGLSTYLHLDRFRQRIPANIPVRGLADAGFFMDYPSISGQSTYTPYMQGGFTLWNSTGAVNQNCIAAYPENEQWHCIMAQYTYPHIQTPMFILNSKYDSWQVEYVLDITCVPWDGSPSNCNAQDLQAFYNFGNATQGMIMSMFNPAKDGMWVCGCVQHCQSLDNGSVLAWVNLTIDATTPDQAFYQWYTTGKAVYIDLAPYGKGETCPQ